MQNKNNKFKKRKNNNFNKKNFNPNKSKVKKTLLEDDEIQKLKNSYAEIKPNEIKTFENFPLSKKTQKGLRECKYRVPTEIQRQSIGYSLQGKDVLAAAVTGSGKTLAFLIPILENLFLRKWTRMDGVGAIVITPTRELAYQIFETLKKVGIHHEFSAGLIIGGKNLKFEKTRMDQCNIVICTPGRLLQHMDENPLFNCSSMEILVLDEADRCLDLGFSETMNAIIENLPPERQTLLFSATQTKSVKDLARLSLKSPVYVAPHEKAEHSTPESLQQNYVVVNLEDKLTMLWSFIKNHLRMKCIVFLSTCKQVKYIYEIFSKLRPGISLLALYGTLHQDRRMAIYDEFCRRSKVILFATDIASRGLDFPVVNWVIQLDCPEDGKAYIHRAGRTARHKSYGESLLVLTPNEEEGIVEELKANKIPINKIQIDPKRLFSPRVKMEAYVAQSTELKESAQRAFVAYIKSVYLMKNKKIFDVEKLNFDEYAKSLGLVVTPRVRFLQRLKKKKQIQQGDGNDEEGSESEEEKGSESEDKPTIDLNALMADESDDDAGLFKIKRTNHELEEEIDQDETPLEDLSKKKKEKVITKASIAKKIIKKNIKANKRVVFDEEGKEIINTAKELQSEMAKEYLENEDGGIDIEKAKELLREEDKFDKQRYRDMVKLKHKEQKKKLKKKQKKESEDEDEEDVEDYSGSESGDDVDTSWLPDPDKIYGKSTENDEESGGSEADYQESDNEYSDEAGSDISDEEEGPIHKLPKQLYEKKRAGDESEEDQPSKKKPKKDIISKLSLNEAESLAMSLLGS